MKQSFYSLCHAAVCVVAFFVAFVITQGGAAAQNPQDKQPTVQEMASAEADRLEQLLELEVWQVFYVDSTLQHDYAALEAEFKDLQNQKVTNLDVFTSVRDKWADQIDATYQKIFNEEQWAIYMKSGAAKAQKARVKRREKAAKLAAKGKK